MCAHWEAEQLRNVAEGVMSFAPAESRLMRERLLARQSAQAKPAGAAQQETLTAVSAAPR
jgi:hypothetical protein